MTEPQPLWTREARDYVLAGISVTREFKGGGVEFGAQDAVEEIAQLVVRFGGSSDSEGLASLVIGLTRLADLLLDWIENEAANKEALIAQVTKMFPDFEHSDSYPTDPSWSTWSGVLRAIEKTVKNSPVSE